MEQLHYFYWLQQLNYICLFHNNTILLNFIVFEADMLSNINHIKYLNIVLYNNLIINNIEHQSNYVNNYALIDQLFYYWIFFWILSLKNIKIGIIIEIIINFFYYNFWILICLQLFKYILNNYIYILYINIIKFDIYFLVYIKFNYILIYLFNFLVIYQHSRTINNTVTDILLYSSRLTFKVIKQNTRRLLQLTKNEINILGHHESVDFYQNIADIPGKHYNLLVKETKAQNLKLIDSKKNKLKISDNLKTLRTKKIVKPLQSKTITQATQTITPKKVIDTIEYRVIQLKLYNTILDVKTPIDSNLPEIVDDTVDFKKLVLTPEQWDVYWLKATTEDFSIKQISTVRKYRKKFKKEEDTS